MARGYPALGETSSGTGNLFHQKAAHLNFWFSSHEKFLLYQDLKCISRVFFHQYYRTPLEHFQTSWFFFYTMLLLLLSHFSRVWLCATPQTAAHQDSLSKNTGVGCHFLLQCMKVKSESEITQSCATLSDSMDCSPTGSFVHGIFQARVLEWCAIAFSIMGCRLLHINKRQDLNLGKLWKILSCSDI